MSYVATTVRFKTFGERLIGRWYFCTICAKFVYLQITTGINMNPILYYNPAAHSAFEHSVEHGLMQDPILLTVTSFIYEKQVNNNNPSHYNNNQKAK